LPGVRAVDELADRAGKCLESHLAGDPRAADELMPLVYDELRRLAALKLGDERPNHTLGPTALVHEAFVRLVSGEVSWQGRTHFMAIAARTLRRVLVDHARARRAAKRGGGVLLDSLIEEPAVLGADPVDVLAVDSVLERLARVNERQAALVELRVFGGLTVKETAEALGVSADTLKSDWRFARAWLKRELRRGDDD
jgi:RNA polymerase sigma factor (TIGR02999 family)